MISELFNKWSLMTMVGIVFTVLAAFLFIDESNVAAFISAAIAGAFHAQVARQAHQADDIYNDFDDYAH